MTRSRTQIVKLHPLNLKRQLDKHPDLCVFGFRYASVRTDYCVDTGVFAKYRANFLEPEYLRQVGITCKYLNRFDLDKRVDSYALKHRIERWGRGVDLSGYVSNGCAILGAILCDYSIVRERNSPNCGFNWA